MSQNSINLQKILEEKYKPEYIYIIEFDKYIYLDAIIVKEENRCKGIGSCIMNDIIDYAKTKHKPIVLLPALDYGANSLDRLKAFYSRFGFIDNKVLRDKRFRIKEMVRLV